VAKVFACEILFPNRLGAHRRGAGRVGGGQEGVWAVLLAGVKGDSCCDVGGVALIVVNNRSPGSCDRLINATPAVMRMWSTIQPDCYEDEEHHPA